MGVPNKKLKKLMLTIGIALGVYAGLKYLLPLVIPFFIALGLAEALRPWALWIQKKCSFSVKGHRFQLPLGLIGGILLFGIMIAAAVLCYVAGGKLLSEGKLLLQDLPRFTEEAKQKMAEWCMHLEEALRLESGCVLKWAEDVFKNLGSQAGELMMPYVMGNSMAWAKAAVKAAVLLVVIVFGTILALQDGDEIHSYFCRSAFHQEYVQMGRILKVIGAAYGKTQLLILAGTVMICMGGLFLIGNPYYGILGLVIGLLDALPFIGTGTILFPWAFSLFLGGNGGRGAVLLGIYLASYFLRQIMESKVMGKKAGLSPFLTLAAVYVGIQLFGILGVILGPLGFLIIRESVDA
ncbi:MAG: AI-2E family transporter [Lachnospiraceae bacterium]|jgi:sporulation integral membrane protein YtvI|nr:AI-2E family transporter [Lachnospiraceae bacterium]